LQSALNASAEKGFKRTAISKSSKKADVGESTVSDCFRGKGDFIFHIPVEMTNHLIDNLKEHLRMGSKMRKVTWHHQNSR
jgi:hypothetical protein